MRYTPLLCTVMSLVLSGCTTAAPVSTKVTYVKYQRINGCEDYSLATCAPTTNGELFMCAVELQTKLRKCLVEVKQYNKWHDEKGPTRVD